MIAEKWKTIEGIGLYEVSDSGKVRNIKTGRVIRESRQPTGNIIVCLSNRGYVKTYSVGRLVLEAFKPNADSDKLRVLHIDGDKNNNRLSNLEWSNKTEVATRLRSMTAEVKELRNILHKTIDKILEEFCKANMIE